MERTEGDGAGMIYPDLRDYQIDVRDRTRTAAAKCRKPVRVILQCSTGGGKSVIGLDLILRCYEKGKRALFIVSGRVLVNQFEKYMMQADVPFGIIMAGRGWNNAPVQIASKETLAARLVRRQVMELPPADLVLCDEVHESTAKEWVALLDRYKESVVVGLTATPALGNGKGLGHVWNGMEKAISTKKLVDAGWLVPCTVFDKGKPDLKGIKIDSKTGDYNKNQLAARMDKPKLTGNAVVNWKKHADGRRTVSFATNIQHAEHICAEYNAAGIRFRHIDQTTPDDEREEIFGLIKDGLIYGFTNVSVARRGLDLPCLECAQILRPTRSLVLWLQMIGRIRRPSPETRKTDSIVLDHAGAADMHCQPDDEIDWDLDAKNKIGDWLDKQKKEGKMPKSIACPKCDCRFSGTNRCPKCGHELKAKITTTKVPEHADGILVEHAASNGTLVSLEEYQRYWDKCIGVVVNTNRKMSVTVSMFKEKYKRLPWTVPGLKYVPEAGPLWQSQAAHLFPSFKREKAVDEESPLFT